MHILIPAIIDLKTTAPNRLHQFIKHFSKKHDITVVCIKDYWKAVQIDSDKEYQDSEDIFSNVRIIYFTDKKISPILQELLSPFLLRYFKSENYDIIFNYNTLVSGNYLAKKFHIPMVYDIADDLPAMIRDSPQIPWPFMKFGEIFGELMIKSTIKHSKYVTGINDIFKEKYLISDMKFNIVSNGVDTTLFREVNSAIKADLNIEKYFVFGYVGVLREWVDFEPIYQVLKRKNDIKLIIVGKEGQYQENLQRVKDLNIEDKVFFTGTIPYETVPYYIAAMDVCLIPFKNNEITQNAFPLKLLEYMACEKPVISSRLKGVQQVAGDKIFYSDTWEEYLEVLKKIKEMDSDLISLIKSNRNFVEDFFTWNQSSNLLLKIIES